jgi:putative flippase GtrA
MMRMVRAHFIRYVLIGLGLAAALYATCFLPMWRIMGSAAAIRVTFSVGALLSFLAHRSLTFCRRGDQLATLRRFPACYAVP